MAEQFNAGDLVYITDYGSRMMSKAIITRVTKTQVVIEHERYEQRFNRKTGCIVGGGPFDNSRISHPTSALDKEWHRRKVHRARIALVEAAKKDDADTIRVAYAKWDRLEAQTDD